MPNFISRYSIFFILFCLAIHSIAQETTNQKEDLKVGLVLSGGGAKGLAHIGVIKVLEEYGIKPDIVTGTSMGSIVGSMYAAGYSVEEMTEINRTANWDQLLTDDIQLRKVGMEEKAEIKKYLFEIPIQDNKINLPAGLIEGHHLENYFSELFWPLPNHLDFDSLPVPFRCMSVDLLSGNTIEHKSGDLVRSVRASMSIPTVFSPVQMDSMLLVDGGVTKNFPVQEAIDLGADIIIGVYVGFDKNATAKDLGSMTNVLSRATALAGIVDARAEIEKCDILIIPDLGVYGAGDFTKGPIIQDLGEKAAREFESEIKVLSQRINKAPRTIQKIDQPHKILIENIEVSNHQYLTTEDVIAHSGLEAGDSLSHDDIIEAIEFMHGTGYFRKLTYALQKNESEEGYTLVFQVKENSRAMFKMAPYYDDDLGVGLVANLTARNVITPSSKFLVTINIAENPGGSLVFDNKLARSKNFINHFFMNYYSYRLPYYVDGDRLGSYKNAYYDAGYGIHFSPGLSHQLGVEALYRYHKLTPYSELKMIFDEANFDWYKAHEFGVHAFYKLNSLDAKYFPTKGRELNLYFTHIFTSNSTIQESDNGFPPYFAEDHNKPYTTWEAEYNWYKTFWDRLTYRFGTGVGINTEFAGTNGMFFLGGLQYYDKRNYRDFAGYNYAELLAPNFTYLRSALSLKLVNGLYLCGMVNGGNIAETYEDMFDNFSSYSLGDYIWGYNVGVKYSSIIGPIQLFLADNNKDGEVRFHLSVGFNF